MEEPWRATLAASLLRLPIPACDARRRQRAGTVQFSCVRPRNEAERSSDLLIRGLGQVVQDRPEAAVRWADVPHLSAPLSANALAWPARTPSRHRDDLPRSRSRARAGCQGILVAWRGRFLVED